MKIRFIGDLETDVDGLFDFHSKNKEEVDLQILLGDCGFFFHRERLKTHKTFYERHSRNLVSNYNLLGSKSPPKLLEETWLVKSEHDDPALFDMGDESPLHKLNITPIDQGVIKKDGKVIVIFGGTFSTAKSSTPRDMLMGTDRRFFSRKEVYKIIAFIREKKVKVDLLVTHQASTGVLPKIPRKHLNNKAASDEGAYPLKTLLEVLEPRFYVHGHHHINYETTFGDTKVYGVGNFSKNPKSQIILDI